MSELKAIQGIINGQQFELYFKSEADKVIAELKAQKDAKILALDAEVFKQKHHAKLFFDERNYAETQLRHHKYKRCLAMANMCERKRVDAANYRIPIEKWEFYEKWHKRWLKIAEKFKTNSTINRKGGYQCPVTAKSPAARNRPRSKA